MGKSAIDRFWGFVDKCGEDECWNWIGAVGSHGYGVLSVENRRVLAHRFSWSLANGALPEAVCHSCDNRKCCNPSHMFGGVRADNNRDMYAKGRSGHQLGTTVPARGTAHGLAKLTENAVVEIRRKYATGLHPQRDLAKEFGVSQRSVAQIIHRVCWTHV